MITPQQKQYKVLLIGDSCIDEYIYGNCERLNPEAPVPILNFNRREIRHGMASNVKENLKSFGIDVYMITNKEKIVKTRYVDEKHNHQILRMDIEEQISPMKFDICYENYDLIVISDYDKGFVTQHDLFKIVSNSNIPVFIDSKKTILPQSNCFIKINDSEYKKLENAHIHENIIVTKGSLGATYKQNLYPGERVNVFDVVGAGDTFLSALVYFYLKCGTIEKSIPYANKAASIAVQNFGTYILSEDDVNEICD